MWDAGNLRWRGQNPMTKSSTCEAHSWTRTASEHGTTLDSDSDQELVHVWERDTRIVRSQEFFPGLLCWAVIQMRR